MSAYILMSDVTGMIPGPFLTQALDDNNDGAADPDVWSQVVADASGDIDGILGGRYTVPFSNPIPAKVVRATKIAACYRIYQRRGKPDKDNPFAKQWADTQDQLKKVAAGDEALDPSLDRAKPSASAITEPSKTASSTGKISA